MITSFFTKLEDNKILTAIKEGMILAIPTIMVGSISLLFMTFPLPIYQEFISSLFNGVIIDILSFLYNTTTGIISLILLISISYSYGKIYKSEYTSIIPIVSICSFLAYAGIGKLNNSFEIFNINWIFTSAVIAITSSMLFIKLSKWYVRNSKYHIEGSKLGVNTAILSTVPFIVVVLAYSVLHIVMISLIGEVNFQSIFLNIILTLFSSTGRNLLSALLFIFSNHAIWFMGAHGANVLDNVATEFFQSGMQINIELLSANQIPTEIFTKTFFDTMVLFGDSGSLLCLVISIFISGKNRNIKKIAKISVLPAIFNINEILILGIPVVLNPVLFIPFILTPMVLTITSYIAMSIGLVPCTIFAVEWTTPIFFSGYMATNSLRGSLLQLVNLILGTLIYIPFIKLLEERDVKIFDENIHKLTDIVKECEEIGESTHLLDESGRIGSISRMLLEDIKYAIKNNEMELFYQPQVNYDGKILGAEALLRWNHSIGGYLYPPLVISLAKEGKILDQLEEYILDKACKSLKKLEDIFGGGIKISVNVSPYQIKNDCNFSNRIKSIIEKYKIDPNMFGIEITEQAALSGARVIKNNIEEIRNLGIKLIMDDFGMGHSSLVHLNSNHFDVVKLDGSLVKGLLTNGRSSNIIESIVYLSNSLNFNIIVEYVETIEQRDKLKDLGCKNYQGYLYSKAISFEDLVIYINKSLYKESL